jgi:hypothetical protein
MKNFNKVLSIAIIGGLLLSFLYSEKAYAWSTYSPTHTYWLKMSIDGNNSKVFDDYLSDAYYWIEWDDDAWVPSITSISAYGLSYFDT